MDISYITNTRGGLNIGCRSQALGTVQAMKRIYEKTGKTVTLHEYDVSEVPALAEILHKPATEPHIVIGVGNDGVEAFKQLPAPTNHTALLIGHEVPQDVETVRDKINILAIPEHITNYTEMDGVQCIRTHGVSQSMDAEKMEATCKQWTPKLTKEDGKPVVVALLGGTIEGKDYTQEEAYKLGECVAAKARTSGARVLATNSPRATPEAITSFNDALAKNGCDSAFFPFHGKLDESPFDAMIGMVAHDPRSAIFVAGDSLSMSCEAASQIKPSQLYIVPVSNLSAQYENFVSWMHDTGRAAVVSYSPQNNQYVGDRVAVAIEQPLDAAQQIAGAVGTYLSRTDRTPQLRAAGGR